MANPNRVQEKAYQRAFLLLKEARMQGATQDEPTGDVLMVINHLDEKNPQSNIFRNAFEFEKSHRARIDAIIHPSHKVSGTGTKATERPSP